MGLAKGEIDRYGPCDVGETAAKSRFAFCRAPGPVLTPENAKDGGT